MLLLNSSCCFTWLVFFIFLSAILNMHCFRPNANSSRAPTAYQPHNGAAEREEESAGLGWAFLFAAAAGSRSANAETEAQADASQSADSTAQRCSTWHWGKPLGWVEDDELIEFETAGTSRLPRQEAQAAIPWRSGEASCKCKSLGIRSIQEENGNFGGDFLQLAIWTNRII